ncbi:MAG: hypothetical protein Q9218_006652, partial [Villophora microphyllina]
FWDVAGILKSLDVYLAHCPKSEGGKIDHITYGRITDIASMYNIFDTLIIHRPSISLDRPNAIDVAENHDSRAVKLWGRDIEVGKMFENPRLFNLGHTLDSLDAFRMPYRKRDLEWLKRADSARGALSKVWSAARDSYDRMLRAVDTDVADRESIPDMLSYHDSPEFKATVA